MKAVLSFAFALSVGIAMQAAPLFETVTVYPTSPQNRPNYRIPALLRVPNGDLLVLSEKRIDGIGDIGDHDIVATRSTDLGHTWSKDQLIFDDGDRTCADLTLCVDAERGRIFLFFLRDKKKFAYFTSDDSGLSWQGPVMVHDSVVRPEWDRLGLDSSAATKASVADPESGKSTHVREWSRNWVQRYGVGPGVGGVQVTHGAHRGRLLVPARHLEYDERGKAITYSHVIYSDDHGNTWHLGPNVAKYGNECRMVELPNGDLMMNMRNANPADGPENSRRLIALSHDGGDTWDHPYRDDALVSTTVHAGLRVYHAVGSSDDGVVLFSNPAAPIRQDAHPYGRYNLTVRWSRDQGQTWSAGRPIYPATSSYSDMAVLGDGTVGIVYERGAKHSDHYWDELQFARFNLEWLFSPPHTPVK